jgi:hypothetical protein
MPNQLVVIDTQFPDVLPPIQLGGGDLMRRMLDRFKEIQSNPDHRDVKQRFNERYGEDSQFLLRALSISEFAEFVMLNANPLLQQGRSPLNDNQLDELSSKLVAYLEERGLSADTNAEQSIARALLQNFDQLDAGDHSVGMTRFIRNFSHGKHIKYARAPYDVHVKRSQIIAEIKENAEALKALVTVDFRLAQVLVATAYLIELTGIDTERDRRSGLIRELDEESPLDEANQLRAWFEASKLKVVNLCELPHSNDPEIRKQDILLTDALSDLIGSALIANERLQAFGIDNGLDTTLRRNQNHCQLRLFSIKRRFRSSDTKEREALEKWVKQMYDVLRRHPSSDFDIAMAISAAIDDLDHEDGKTPEVFRQLLDERHMLRKLAHVSSYRQTDDWLSSFSDIPHRSEFDAAWRANSKGLFVVAEEYMGTDEEFRRRVINRSLKRPAKNTMAEENWFGKDAVHKIALDICDDPRLSELMSVASSVFRAAYIDFSKIIFCDKAFADVPERIVAYDRDGTWVLQGLLLISEIEQQQVLLGKAQSVATGAEIQMEIG